MGFFTVKRLARGISLPLLAAGLLLRPGVSMAIPILGGLAVVTTTGPVVATFVSQTASFDNELFLDSPVNGLGVIFNNHINNPGDMVNLGTFAAGTELIFRLHVVPTGDNFFTGPGSRNPDGIAHAIVNDMFAPGQTSVAFEDLNGGGDRDFDDTIFSFTNVSAVSVPEPASLLLLASGLVGLAGLRFRKK